MPIRVLLQSLKPTMRLARPIFDADGGLVAGAGTQLRDGVLRALRKMALQSVLVVDSDKIPQWDTLRPLGEELADLDRRIGAEERRGALAALHAAVARHLTTRAARLAEESDDAAPEPER